MKKRRFAVVVLLLAAASAFAEAPFQRELVLREALGHSWGPALVHRRVRVAEQGRAFCDRLILLRDQAPVPFQLDNVEVFPDGSLRAADVWFRSDLPAGTERVLELHACERSALPAAALETDLAVRTEANTLELRNAHTAVRLHAGAWSSARDGPASGTLAEHLGVELPTGCGAVAPGPVAGIELASGEWDAATFIAPSSVFTHDIDLIQPVDPSGSVGAVNFFETRLLDRGPIFLRARSVFRFEGGGHYTCTVTLRSREPLVRIDEEYERAGSLVLRVTNTAPASLVYESSRPTERGRSVAIDYRARAKLGLLVGWDYFFNGIAPCFGLAGDPGGDFVGFVSTDSDWLPFPYNQALHLFAGPGPVVEARACLGRGHRHWALHVARAADFDADPKAHLRWWYEHVALPLDKVANWQVTWPDMDEAVFPHTFFDPDELPVLRERLRAAEPLRRYAENLKPKKFTDAAAALLYSGDPVHFDILEDPAQRYVDGLPAAFLERYGYWEESYLNYMQISDELLQRYVGLELLLGSDRLNGEERRQLLTRLAFAQYLMDDRMFWPPNYDYSPQKEPYPAYVQGTPNQKICYLTARGIVGCMLRNHPEFDRWMERVLEEWERVASGSVAPSGAHLESPFYSSRDTMRFGPFWSALTRAGAGGEAAQRWLPRLKRCYEYLSDMLTPPEPRFDGVRVYHPIGRSSPGVVDPTMMIACEPFGRDDPAFCRRMRWCWEQQGRPAPDVVGTTGGRDMSLTMLAAARMLQHEPCAVPPLRSVRWEGMGAIFRSRVGTDHESNVVFRHDPFCWNLYEANNGAVYFYGKGVPLLPRFGGYWMSQKGQPNLMSVPFGNRLVFAQGDSDEPWLNGLGQMRDYASLGELADFAAGVTRDGHWQRSVLFAKDLDGADPVYLLVRDDVGRPDSPSALHWWIMSKQVQPDGVNAPGVAPFKGTDEEWLANLGANWKEAPPMSGRTHRFEMHYGVALDMYIAMPADPRIVTDGAGVGSLMPYCRGRNVHEYQQLVRIEQAAEQDYVTLFAPRAVDAAAPEFRTIAGGAGVAVDGAARRDRLFLSEGPVTFQDDVVTFSGRAGFARLQGGPLRLMVVDGEITAGGITLRSAEPAALLFDGNTVTLQCADVLRHADLRLAPELQGVEVLVRRSGE